jgi:hypothetical protein
LPVLTQWRSDLSWPQNHLEICSKQINGPHPYNCDSVGLWWTWEFVFLLSSLGAAATRVHTLRFSRFSYVGDGACSSFPGCLSCPDFHTSQHSQLWKLPFSLIIALSSKCLTPMFSLVLGPMLCHLGCAHPRTPLPDLKQIKNVFCHLHMPYSVEHMVVAHLTNTVGCHGSFKGEVPVLIFCSILPPLSSFPALI